MSQYLANSNFVCLANSSPVLTSMHLKRMTSEDLPWIPLLERLPHLNDITFNCSYSAIWDIIRNKKDHW